MHAHSLERTVISEQNTSKGQRKKINPAKYIITQHTCLPRGCGGGVGWGKVVLWHFKGTEEERAGEMTLFLTERNKCRIFLTMCD